MTKEGDFLNKDTRFLPNGWQWVRLGNICKIQNGYAFKSSDFLKKGIPVVKMGSIGKNFCVRWDIGKLDYLPEEFLKNYSNFVVSNGDLLISLTDMSPSGEYLGTVAIYDLDFPALLNQRVGKFVNISTKVDKFYLYYCLRSREFREFATHDDTGNLQKNTNPEYLYNYEIPLPSPEEQRRIVTILNEQMVEIKKAKLATEAQLEAIDKLPSSLLRKAFKGEL